MVEDVVDQEKELGLELVTGLVALEPLFEDLLLLFERRTAYLGVARLWKGH